MHILDSSMPQYFLQNFKFFAKAHVFFPPDFAPTFNPCAARLLMKLSVTWDAGYSTLEELRAGSYKRVGARCDMQPGRRERDKHG